VTNVKLGETVTVAKGGTGAATHTANNVLVGAGTSAVTSVAPSTSGNVLTSNGTVWQSTAPSASTLAASTTVGTGAEEDTKIVFDGHAQDYYVGLDDTDDDFKIGLGSSVGTTTHMSFDETGAILKPLQPSFQAQITSAMNNLSVNTQHNVTMDNEIFDQNGDFNTSNYTFTAPVTGRYVLCVSLRMENLDTATGYYECHILASSKQYTVGIIDPDSFDTDATYYSFCASHVVNMDASDTALVRVYVDTGGSAQADISSGTNSMFSGCLLA
jgi:hypothetical protein